MVMNHFILLSAKNNVIKANKVEFCQSIIYQKKKHAIVDIKGLQVFLFTIKIDNQKKFIKKYLQEILIMLYSKQVKCFLTKFYLFKLNYTQFLSVIKIPKIKIEY